MKSITMTPEEFDELVSLIGHNERKMEKFIKIYTKKVLIDDRIADFRYFLKVKNGHFYDDLPDRVIVKNEIEKGVKKENALVTVSNKVISKMPEKIKKITFDVLHKK